MRNKYRLIITLSVVLALALVLVGCGGGGGAPEASPAGTGGQAPADTAAEEAAAAPAAEENEEAAEPAAAEAEAEASGSEAAEANAEEGEEAEEAAADDPNLIAGLPASGIDAESGLEINPPTIVPGVDFIVRGTVISFNLTPQDNPEFLIESPSGTRYRVNSQPVPEIAFTDGRVLLAHEYQRGLLAQATVRQEEGSGVTSVVITENLVLLSEE